VVDFVFIAAVVSVLAKLLLASMLAPATRNCPECLDPIPIAARKCRACGSAVA
jgi:hypothetical protein